MRLPLRYLVLVGLPIAVLLIVIAVGGGPKSTPAIGAAAHVPAGPSAPTHTLLLAQLVVILAVAIAAGRVARWIGQPAVVGEMAAGLLLGPSLLGWLSPGVYATLFPASSLGALGALSQVGLLLFMFAVGLELDLRMLRGQGTTAVLVSHASMAMPFALGVLVAVPLHPRFAPAGVGFVPFALFIGTSMSVTAFPVLARILRERELTHTRLGTLAIACAAVDDVTAWCILAGVVVVARASATALPLWATAAGVLAYAALMLTIGRRLLAPLASDAGRAGDDRLGAGRLALVVGVAIASALATEWLGVHALFGAFVAGVVMPRGGGFAAALASRVQGVVVTLLLPLFFAITGLRTVLPAPGDATMWAWGAALLAIAVAGKLGGSAVAARAAGMAWRESAALGALMNTRGLMELVVLNMGLDIGVLPPSLFGLLVIMALTTTVMTTPLVTRLLRPAPAGSAVAASPTFVPETR